jgi:2'-5' RNA ligase
MARRANGAGVPASGPAIDWAITHYALVESRQGQYTVLRRVDGSPSTRSTCA